MNPAGAIWNSRHQLALAGPHGNAIPPAGYKCNPTTIRLFSTAAGGGSAEQWNKKTHAGPNSEDGASQQTDESHDQSATLAASQYATHSPLNVLQKGAVAVFSALGALNK